MLKKRVILYAIFPRKEEKLLLLKVWLNSYLLLTLNVTLYDRYRRTHIWSYDDKK
jgi:hypothetical protein